MQTCTPYLLTANEVSKLLGISVRQVKKGRFVARVRPDLGLAILAGKLSMDHAYRIAKGQRRKSNFEKLWSVWLATPWPDRMLFLEHSGVLRQTIEIVLNLDEEDAP